MVYIIQTAFILGAIYALVSLALFLSFRILNIADLTTDGCFVLGAAVSVTCAYYNHPLLGILLGMCAGGLAGFVTAYLHTFLDVPDILAGIITNTGLYTINLMAMGWSSNVSLLRNETIFTLFQKYLPTRYSSLILALLITITAMVLMKLFMQTRLGLSIRATGDNRAMVSASSISTAYTVTVGLVVANMLTGLAGAVAGQYQKAADINSGTGIVVVGLACLIIGETLLQGRKSMSRNISAVLVGNIIYRFIYAGLLKTKIVPVEFLKLMTALVVALAISYPTIKEKLAYKAKQHREK